MYRTPYQVELIITDAARRYLKDKLGLLWWSRKLPRMTFAELISLMRDMDEKSIGRLLFGGMDAADLQANVEGKPNQIKITWGNTAKLFYI